MKVLVLLGVLAVAFATKDLENVFLRKNIGNAESSKLADSLENIPGVVKAMETPIIDVDQTTLVTAMERVIRTLEKEVPTECKDSLLVQIVTGIIRSRVSRALEHGLRTTRVATTRPVLRQIKEKIQEKVVQILRNVGGDCHLERLIIQLPSLVNVEVIQDRTLGDFIGYMAKDIQSRIKPLTTGGSSIDCTVDRTDVARALRQLTAYLETGYKETLKLNFPEKTIVEKILAPRFQEIVEEVEKLMRKFETGENKECFMELYRETFQETVTDVTAVRVLKRSGVETQILETVRTLVKAGRTDVAIKTLIRLLTVHLKDKCTSAEQLKTVLQSLANLLESDKGTRTGAGGNFPRWSPNRIPGL